MKLFDVYPRFEVEPVKAEGCYLWDAAGDRYLDMYGGHAVISIGHGHPRYQQRITEQLGKLGFYSNAVPITLQDQVAEKLGEISCYVDWNIFFVNSGAEAIENALKVASAHNGRRTILAFEGAFHGRTSLAVAVTDNPRIQFPVNEGADVVRIPLNNHEAAKKAFDEHDICCVLIEGIQGVGGIREPETGFLKQLRSLCDESGALLILDEIQSGFGRTGMFFAHQHHGVIPDIVTTAKGMGNGFPVGAVWMHPDLKATHGMLGTTFGGNHLACAATLAVAEILEEEKLAENAARMGSYLMEELASLKGLKELRGRGLMIGIELDQPVAALRKRLLHEHHIFTGSSSDPNTIRILPPLTVGTDECDQFLTAIREECR
jgi:acetylornithine aminotransferase